MRQVRGVIKHILNENFGLVWGPLDSRDPCYCLFDTCDLTTNSMGTTAYERNRAIGEVIYFLLVNELLNSYGFKLNS